MGAVTGPGMNRRQVLSTIGGLPFAYGAVGGVTAVERPGDAAEYETGHTPPEREVFIFQGDRRIRNLLITRTSDHSAIDLDRFSHHDFGYRGALNIAQGAPTINTSVTITDSDVQRDHHWRRYNRGLRRAGFGRFTLVDEIDQRFSLVAAPRFGPYAYHIENRGYLFDWNGLVADGSDAHGSNNHVPYFTVDNNNFNLAFARPGLASRSEIRSDPRSVWYIRPVKGPSIQLESIENVPNQFGFSSSQSQYYCTIQNVATENYIARPEWAGVFAYQYSNGDFDRGARGRNEPPIPNPHPNPGPSPGPFPNPHFNLKRRRARNKLFLIGENDNLESHYSNMYDSTSMSDDHYYNHLLFRIVESGDVNANGGTSEINNNIEKYHGGDGVLWGNDGTFPGDISLESTYRISDDEMSDMRAARFG